MVGKDLGKSHVEIEIAGLQKEIHNLTKLRETKSEWSEMQLVKLDNNIADLKEKFETSRCHLEQH